MDLLTFNSARRFRLAAGERADGVVEQTMKLLPPRLRETYAAMRKADRSLSDVRQEAINPTHGAEATLQLARTKEVKAVTFASPEPAQKTQKSPVLAKAMLQTRLTTDEVLSLRPILYSDFALLDALPRPRECNAQMSEEELLKTKRQRAFFMEEMERFSKELMQVLNE